MATSVVPTFMDTFCEQLRNRAGLAGAGIFSGPMGVDTPPRAIVLFSVDEGQDWGAIGNRRKDEQFTVDGATWIEVAGADEATIKTARDEAFALMAEVEDQLREDPAVNGVLQTAAINGMRFEQGINPEGRWAQVTFTILGKAWLQRY